MRADGGATETTIALTVMGVEAARSGYEADVAVTVTFRSLAGGVPGAL
jgi:hypothetical protein